MTGIVRDYRLKHAPNPQGGSRSQPHQANKWARSIGALILFIYFIRGTVIPNYLHAPESVWIAMNSLSLLLGAIVAIGGQGKWHWKWIGVLFAFALGIIQAEQPSSSALRWLGLFWLVLAMGPVIQNSAAVQMRATAWKYLINGMVLLTGIFVVWYVLRLPSLGGRVFFTSFMNQSMMLGPIAGMGSAIALVHAFHKQSWKWALLAVFGLVPMLASGSRLAAIASGASICFLIIRRKPALGMAVSLAFGLAIYSYISLGHALQESESFAGALAKKGTDNSRLDMWQSRLDEFKSSPLIGIGVAMGSGQGAGKDSDGNIRVEPGSSYLALLAMTGGLGTLAFFLALGSVVFRFANSRQGSILDTDILSVIGIFMAVHAIAEGWILGYGSPLCFIFWLWLGALGDAATRPQLITARSSIHKTRSIVRSSAVKCLSRQTAVRRQ
jgi:hypothetical protein